METYRDKIIWAGFVIGSGVWLGFVLIDATFKAIIPESYYIFVTFFISWNFALSHLGGNYE